MNMMTLIGFKERCHLQIHNQKSKHWGTILTPKKYKKTETSKNIN